MLKVPAKLVESRINVYNQTCKRAKNLLEILKEQTYVVTHKSGWLRREKSYTVNVFGEHKLKDGNFETILESLLENDRISVLDYQLLKFYDGTLVYDEVIEEILARKTAQGTIKITALEMGLINEIATFVEDEGITKEEILSGKQL